MIRVLILGGTSEAAALAEALARGFSDRVEVITSLAGRTRSPRPLPGTVRVGGFGGADGLAAYLKDERIDAVIDATHPFATGISAHAAVAADRAGIPRVVLSRPRWQPVAGDRWIEVADLARAAQALREQFANARAFLAVGSGGLAPFAGLADRSFVIRVAEPLGRNPPPDSVVVVDRGPFSEVGDIELLKANDVGVVVCKNAGGDAAYAKIAAARALGIPVVMVARPPAPPGRIVASVDDVVRWLSNLVTPAMARESFRAT